VSGGLLYEKPSIPTGASVVIKNLIGDRRLSKKEAGWSAQGKRMIKIKGALLCQEGYVWKRSSGA